LQLPVKGSPSLQKPQAKRDWRIAKFSKNNNTEIKKSINQKIVELASSILISKRF
jgi:hypothetical protein